ncbi:sensor histidine kinase [Streptomyces sp. bgisy100]|uniref:sensor histidine kinase n=1 Tax=Streptomyces sp. bgisy100 TaxID=3413783 RepID=UPI003D7168EF
MARGLVVPTAWSGWRIAGETVLSLVMGLLAAGIENLADNGLPRIVAVALCVAVLSALRRVLPGTVLVVVAAAAGLLEGFALLLILAGWSAGRAVVGRGRTVGAFVAAFVLNTVLTTVSEFPQMSLPTFLVAAISFLALTVVPGLWSRYRSQRRTLLRTLQEHNSQLLRERAMVAGQARMRERQRIAQDMHDSLGHQLALVAVHTGALEVDPELTGRQREVVGVLREASVSAMHELRQVVGILRDGTEAPEPAEGAQPASRVAAGIEGLVETARAAGTRVELRRSGDPRPLAPVVDHAAYRVAQEGLTNAYKYAPGASITVELRYEPDSLVVEVANGPAPAPGPGVAAVSGGQGLTGLRERARLVGGLVHAGATADGGFRLAGVLPYGADGGGGPARRGRADGAPGPFGEGPGLDPAGPGEQVPAAGPGRHGPVPGWSWPSGPVAVAPRRSWSPSRGLRFGCVFTVVLGVVVVGLVVWCFAELLDSMITPGQYRKVEVGRSEESVRAELPTDGTLFTSQLQGGPAEPEGAQCLVLMSTESSDDPDRDTVFRFCFRDGRIVEKRSYEVGA